MTKRPLLESLRNKNRSQRIEAVESDTSRIDDEQLAAYLDGRLTPDELDQFETAAAVSPVRCAELLALDSKPALDRAAEEAALAVMRSAINANVLAHPRNQSRPRPTVPRWAKRVALCLFAAIGIAVIPLLSQRQRPEAAVVDRPPPRPSNEIGSRSRTEDARRTPGPERSVVDVAPDRPPAVPQAIEPEDARDIRILPTAQPEPARIIAVTGLVLQRTTNEWSAARVGSAISVGTIAVPRGAACELQLGTTRIAIAGGSKLTFDELSADSAASTIRLAGRFVGGGRVRIEDAPDDSHICWQTDQLRVFDAAVTRPETTFGLVSDTNDTLAVVFDGALTFDAVNVMSGQSFRIADGSLGPPITVAWRERPRSPWVISNATTQQLTAASDLLDALLDVTAPDDASACTQLAIDLADGPSVFKELAVSDSAAQHQVLQTWLLSAPQSEIDSKQAWTALGQSGVAVENWFALWRRMRTTKRPPDIQRSSLDALLKGLSASQARFVREAAIGILRDLTRQPIASYDPAKPTANGISEATRSANIYWTRYQRARQPQRRTR